MKKVMIAILCAAIAVGGILCLAQMGKEDSTPGQAEFDLGVRYLREGRYEDAVLMFSQAIAIDPNYGPAYFYRASAYQAMAETCTDPQQKAEYLEKAEQDYTKAEVLDPSLSSEAEEKLEEVGSLLERMEENTFSTVVPDLLETIVPTEETEAVEETASTKENQDSPTASGSADPIHAPQVVPTESTNSPSDDVIIEMGDAIVIDPEHNPQIPPEEDTPSEPEHNEQVFPEDDNYGTGLTGPTEGSVPEIPDETVDLGSPDTSDETVDLGTPDVAGETVDLGGPEA